MAALQRAVEKAGGQTKLARRLTELTGKHVRQCHIWSWLNRTKRIPAEMVLPIESAVDAKVTRHELRADLYPRDKRKPV